jgi:hypothetical protein
MDGYFDRALEANIACRDFIVNAAAQNPDENHLLDLYTQRYASDRLVSYQPKEAFIVNARATIACTLREFSTTN